MMKASRYLILLLVLPLCFAPRAEAAVKVPCLPPSTAWPFILLLMAGRSVAPARNGQPYFVDYFGTQFLLPPKPFD